MVTVFVATRRRIRRNRRPGRVHCFECEVVDDQQLDAGQALLGAHPSRCVVIEDSPVGVASGAAAGSSVIAVPSEVVIEPAEDRTIVASLVEVSVDGLRRLVRACVGLDAHIENPARTRRH